MPEMSDHENTSTLDRKVLSPPPISAEKWWELKETELWDKISKRLWKLAAAILTIFLAIITVIGFLSVTTYITTYIHSQFKDIIEQETKTFAKLREAIGGEQAGLYADEKIFIVIWNKYLTESKELSILASAALDQINQQDELNTDDMAEFKKFIIKSINRMGQQNMWVEEYKKFTSEIKTKQWAPKAPSVGQSPFSELIEMYPHISALYKTLCRTVDRFAMKESTDELAKSILFKEYETFFYPAYREEFDAFEPGYYMYAGQHFVTLPAGAGKMFFSLSSELREYLPTGKKPSACGFL
jgi:hypothetical protein